MSNSISLLSKQKKTSKFFKNDDCDEFANFTEFTDIFASNASIDTSTWSSKITSMQNIFNNDTKYITMEEIDTNVNDNLTELESIDYKLCPMCKIPGKLHDTMIICEKCGMERIWDSHSNELYSMTLDQNYNTSNNSYMSFNIVGVNSYCYNRSLMKTCADYSTYRNNSNRKDIINRIYRHEGNHPPNNIINTCVELFDQIKNKNYVYRGLVKWGIVGACLYYASIQHNLTRSPKQITDIMQIDEKFLSQGDRILQELNELGVISIETNYRPLNDYLNQFFPALGIHDKYKQFVIDIISRAERKHLHIKHESRTTSKVIGCIYLLTQRVPELHSIRKETISLECNKISKSTFVKYYTLIMDNYKIMKKVFKRHRIPMPLLWKE